MTNNTVVQELKKRKLKRDLQRPYDELLKEAETKSDEAIAKARHITLEYYVPLLCERLRVEKFKDIDIETSRIEDVKRMRDDIRTRVFNDCYWWEPDSIKHYWPEWAKDGFLVDLRKAEAQKRRDKFSETVSLKDLESNELAEKEFGLLSSVLQQVKTPPKGTEKQSETIGIGIPEKTLLTPEELYGDAVNAILELWKALANKDTLPTKMHDIFGDYIKPSRKFRTRLIKGLDDARAAHLHNSLVWLNQLVTDTVDMMDEVEKQSINVDKLGK